MRVLISRLKVLECIGNAINEIVNLPTTHDNARKTHGCDNERTETHDLISRKAAIDGLNEVKFDEKITGFDAISTILDLPSEEPETIVRCKDCKHWDRQTTDQGVPLSWGHCDSDHMWDSLYGETYEVAYIETNEEHFCGYAERRTE